MNILLVDDRPDKLIALEAALEDLGQNIVKATSGTEALRLLLNQDFAVILLDVSMPVLDGFETASLIRQRPRSEHTPIIFITSINTNETHVTRGYSLGAVDYIFSPVHPEILRAKVNVFIDLFRKTEQIKHQAASLESRLHELLNGLDVGVFRATLEGKLFEANPAFLRLLRLEAPEEMTKFNLNNLFPNFRMPLTRDGVVTSDDFPFSCPGGETIWLSLQLRATSSDDGPIIAGIAEDITRRKLTEQKLRELTETLERRVDERTEELRVSQESLRRTEHLASLGTLAAGIAHEINNPLNSILVAAEVASRKISEPPYVSKSLQIIAEQTKRCGKIIKEVLQFARNEQKPKGEYDLNDVVNRAMELMRSYSRAPIAVDLKLQPGQMNVLVNPREIEQVVINIVQNGIDAAPDKAHIEVSTAKQNGEAILRITDNGPGIPTEIMSKIFDPFFSTRLDKGGTGLGLSVVHGIVSEHGGTISVENNREAGATFSIRLPMVPSGEVAAAAT